MGLESAVTYVSARKAGANKMFCRSGEESLEIFATYPTVYSRRVMVGWARQRSMRKTKCEARARMMWMVRDAYENGEGLVVRAGGEQQPYCGSSTGRRYLRCRTRGCLAAVLLNGLIHVCDEEVERGMEARVCDEVNGTLGRKSDSVQVWGGGLLRRVQFRMGRAMERLAQMEEAVFTYLGYSLERCGVFYGV